MRSSRRDRTGAAAPRSPRGVTLVEALVAMAVMAFGMLALAGVQRTIAINSDISRQVAEATRITANEMAGLRAYVTVDNVTVPSLGPASAAAWRSSWDSLATVALATVALPAGTSDTSFARQTVVRAMEFKPSGLAASVTAPRLKAAAVTTTWSDRAGDARTLGALGMYAAIDTALSTRVVMAAPPTPAVQRGGRSVAIPRGATDLGDGTSAFKPFANPAGEVWIISHDTGLVTQVCTGVTAAQPAIDAATIGAASCAPAGRAYVVSGTVRYDQRITASGSLGPEVARDPQGPALPLAASQPLRMVAGTDENIGSGPTCFAGAPYAVAAASATSAVDYACRIVVAADGGWGGRLELVPDASWSIVGAAASGSHRVCRYTPLAGDEGASVLHPYTYCHAASDQPTQCTAPVRTNLLNQNYLVIRSVSRCPSDTAAALPAANAALGAYVDTNTRPHQPWP